MSNWNWSNFNPKVTKTDKRDRDSAVTKAEKFVEKNFNDLALASYAAVPVVDNNRAIKKIQHFYPPNSPLAAFWGSSQNQEFLKKLNKAIEDTQLWALELWDAKDADNPDKFGDMVGMEVTQDDEKTAPKPAKPIFALSTETMSVFFGEFLKYLYELENVEKVKLWATKDKDGNVLKEPTKLKIYDEKAEEILERNKFIGRGSGGPNIGNKLKIVTAYLMKRIGIDHNEHCDDVPHDYNRVDIDFDNYSQLLGVKKQKEKSSLSRVMKAKLIAEKSLNNFSSKSLNNSSKKRVRYAEESDDNLEKRPRVDQDDAIAELSENEVDEPAPVVATTTPRSISKNTSNTPANILDLIRSRALESPGTPAADDTDDDTEDPLLSQDINEVKEGNVRKAHAGGITTVNIFDVDICKTNGFYRASIADGEDFSNKVLFNSKLNEKVKEELVGEGRVSIVRLDIIDILQNCIVGVQAFTKLSEGPAHVGQAQFLGEPFYRSLKPRGCYTPSRMKKKVLFK